MSACLRWTGRLFHSFGLILTAKQKLSRYFMLFVVFFVDYATGQMQAASLRYSVAELMTQVSCMLTSQWRHIDAS